MRNTVTILAVSTPTPGFAAQAARARTAEWLVRPPPLTVRQEVDVAPEVRVDDGRCEKERG